MNLREHLKTGMLLLDGGTGTMLQRFGMPLGTIPETLNIERPEWILRLHKGYIEAGSDVIYANTFGANRLKLENTSYSVSELVQAAIRLARQAVEEAGAGTLVALDIGPLGQLLAPTGTLTFEEAYDLFSEIVEAGKYADLVIIETMTDLQETKAAVLAAKEHSDLPVFVTMTFEENRRTFTGVSVPAMCLTLEGLGVDALGVNCSLGPRELLPIVEEIGKWTRLPIIVKPNAGLPDPVTNTYDITPDEFVEAVRQMLPFGPRILGGCCGTDPSYIKGLRSLIDTYERVAWRHPRTISPTAMGMMKSEESLPPACHSEHSEESPKVLSTCDEILRRSASQDDRNPATLPLLTLCSATRTVTVDRPRIIGERINPTGKKRFREALASGDMDYILRQAIEQVEAGADILDVNVGAPGIDEKDMMVKVIRALQSVTDVPLQLDSTKPEVLEAGLRAYVGKPIVNSVNGEQAVLDRILPLVAKYGAAVVGLTLDENGIPPIAEERFAIAEKILFEAAKYGIPKENVIIDCLVLTVSSEQKAAMETLSAVRMVREHLGLNTCLGVSNISFGLPARGAVNTAFFTMALQAGLTLPIMNPNVSSMMWAYRSFLALCGKDENSLEFITYAQEHKTDAEALAELRKAPANEAELRTVTEERDRLKDALRAITALSATLTGGNFKTGAAIPATAAPENESRGNFSHENENKNFPSGNENIGNASPRNSSEINVSPRSEHASAEHKGILTGNTTILATVLTRPANHLADCNCERCRTAYLLKQAFQKAGLRPNSDISVFFNNYGITDIHTPDETNSPNMGNIPEVTAPPQAGKVDTTLASPSGKAILKAMETGMKAAGREETLRLLETTDSMDIIEGILIPALDVVGEKFEKGKLFLPQLILAADVAKECFDAIKEKISNGTIESKQNVFRPPEEENLRTSLNRTANDEGEPIKRNEESRQHGAIPDEILRFAQNDSSSTCFSSDEQNDKESRQHGSSSAVSRGRILLATVKGDIHDIGKNIVKVILENYGYEVIDLGRDVPPEKIVEVTLEKNVPLVGLSALMTTTLGSMEATIRLLREAKVPCKVMVGGAVLTPEYAKKIGADFYAKDAKQGADIAKQVFG